MKRWAKAEAPAAIAPATMKISSAASTFGRYAQTAATNSSSAAMPRTSSAIESAPRKINQNVTLPASAEGDEVTFETQLPPGPATSVRSKPTPLRARVTICPTTRATM
jgi:hypothetical protein